MRNTLFVIALFTLASGAPAAIAAEGPATGPRGNDLTLGLIQRSIKSGMTTSEVVESVGSPNLVTRGRDGRESWVYDRFSTETSEEGFHVGGGGLGAGGSVLGAVGVDGGKKKVTTSQRTLMLVVTFGADGMVETFTYRSSKF
jgi:hypothetical protein